MKKSLLLALALVFVLPVAARASGSCPSTITCTGASLPLSGYYSCLQAGGSSDGSTKVQVLVVSFTSGEDSFSAAAAKNSNASSGTTYSDFSGNTATGTYCLNSDNTTGFLTPSGGGSCQSALTYSQTNKQLRLIDTEDGRATVAVCKAQ
ncbi:MAG: hypothetical protein ABSD31_07970 [Candidatus Binataceae bacterium]